MRTRTNLSLLATDCPKLLTEQNYCLMRWLRSAAGGFDLCVQDSLPACFRDLVAAWSSHTLQDFDQQW
eukprot:1793314-Karenia_brevis.AAC.1